MNNEIIIALSYEAAEWWAKQSGAMNIDTAEGASDRIWEIIEACRDEL